MNDYKFKISPHKSGLLRGTVTINGRQIHRYGHTEREVKEKLKRIREEAIRGNIIPAKQRLEDAMHSYLFDVKIKTVKGSSFDRVECTFNNQIKGSELGRRMLSGIREEDIQRHLNGLTQTHSISTTKKVYDLLGEFFRYQIAAKQLNHNPMTLVSMPHSSQFRKQPKPMSILTPDEVRRVIEAAESIDKNGQPVYRYGEVTILMLLTGMRSGEVRALRVCDFDEERRIIRVEGNITHHKDRESGKTVDEAASTKTRKSRRDIPLTDRAVAAVKRMMETTCNHETGYLVTTETGRFLSASYLQAQFDFILKRAGVSHNGMHSTRHTFATIVLKDSGAEHKGQIKEVSELLGHAQVSTTYEYYIKTSNEDKRAIVSVLDGYGKNMVN